MPTVRDAARALDCPPCPRGVDPTRFPSQSPKPPKSPFHSTPLLSLAPLPKLGERQRRQSQPQQVLGGVAHFGCCRDRLHCFSLHRNLSPGFDWTGCCFRSSGESVARKFRVQSQLQPQGEPPRRHFLGQPGELTPPPERTSLNVQRCLMWCCWDVCRFGAGRSCLPASAKRRPPVRTISRYCDSPNIFAPRKLICPCICSC
jgi:hypothetical protein